MKSPKERFKSTPKTLSDILGLPFLLVSLMVLVVVFVGILCWIADCTKAEAVVETKVAMMKAPEMPQEITIDEPEPVILTEEQQIDIWIKEICLEYNLDPNLIKSMVWHESRYDAEAYNRSGGCFGLMQINPRWHRDRMERLGVTDLLDPYSNLLVGCDYISELLDRHESPYLALMCYNMSHEVAKKMWRNGQISYYANSVMQKAKQFREEGVFIG